MTRSRLERRFLDIRHDDHRPAGLEQRAFGDQLFDRIGSGFGLADDREIGSARDAGELVAAPAALAPSVDRLGRNASARGGSWRTGRWRLFAAAWLSESCVFE